MERTADFHNYLVALGIPVESIRNKDGSIEIVFPPGVPKEKQDQALLEKQSFDFSDKQGGNTLAKLLEAAKDKTIEELKAALDQKSAEGVGK